MQELVSRVVLPGVDVYSVFTWLVTPVIVSVTGGEPTAMFPFWSWVGYFIFGVTYCFFLYLEGCCISLLQ